MPDLAPRFRPSRAGFTLIEIIIVLAVMMVAMVFVAPTMRTVLHRSKTAGFAQQISLILQQAKFESIKTGAPVKVAVSGKLLVTSSGGVELGRVSVPSRVSFEACTGFGGTESVSFQTDGSVDNTGAFRIIDGWSNQMEVAVEPQATGRIQIRKKNSANVYVTEGTGGAAWTFE